MLMKKLLIIKLLVVYACTSAQEIQPFVKLRSGEKYLYEQVKLTSGGNRVVGHNQNVRTGYKGFELESAMIGFKGNYRQDKFILVRFLEMKRTSNSEGIVLEGGEPYQVLFSNGQQMILSDRLKYPSRLFLRYRNNNGSGFPSNTPQNGGAIMLMVRIIKELKTKSGSVKRILIC